MNLKNFEKFIEPKILDRGFSYYENDYVEDVQQVDKYEYSASVLGSDEYEVYIKLSENDDILFHSCDCPYDWGNVCKHVVAVLHYLQDADFLMDDFKNSPLQKIKKDLQKYSKKELIEMLFGMSKRNKQIREQLLWELGHEE